MLEEYFVRPQTVDRIRASWIGPQIEQYVTWLEEHGYTTRCILRRVPLVTAFGEFAAANGARQLAGLPDHVAAFVAYRVSQSRDARRAQGDTLVKDIRGPVEQMLTLIVPGYEGTGRPRRPDPFGETVPGFFEYLVSERGLRPASVESYVHYLRRFEAWLGRTGVTRLDELSPPLLSAYTAERAGLGLAKTSVREGCGVLRVFLRYARREGVISRDLSEAVEWPQAYRLSTLPRSISWEDVGRVLALPDRRTPGGKRDYAILLLMATYGLRAREITALTLDDIDWKRARLAVPERKAAHSTAFPLSGAAGDALADYLRNGRPQTEDRHVFFRAMAPVRPIAGAAVSSVARRYLLLAGVDVPRPGSHTLRHSAVQRLSDDGFGLKTIGDFVGHRSPASTDIYAKVAVESLREVALGDGEEALQ
ncbi:MAG: tyrosine-type recombinase/integrase [Streptosporangiaceae bacterium]